jgi:hypothetical protein
MRDYFLGNSFVVERFLYLVLQDLIGNFVTHLHIDNNILLFFHLFGIEAYVGAQPEIPDVDSRELCSHDDLLLGTGRPRAMCSGLKAIGIHTATKHRYSGQKHDPKFTLVKQLSN